MLYALIASGLVTVLTGPTAGRDRLALATPAAAVYLVGAVLLLRSDVRRLWVLVALLQLAMVAQYLHLASERAPAFEPWDITIRVLQAALFAVLVNLAIGPRCLARRSRTHLRDPQGLDGVEVEDAHAASVDTAAATIRQAPRS